MSADLNALEVYLAIVPKHQSYQGPVVAHCKIFDGEESVDLMSRHEADPTNANSFALAVLCDVLELVEGCKDAHLITDGPIRLVTVHINNTFVVDGLTKWIKNWKKNGWNTTGGAPVKMKEAWLKAEAALHSCYATVDLVRGDPTNAGWNHKRMNALVRAAATEVGADPEKATAEPPAWVVERQTPQAAAQIQADADQILQEILEEANEAGSIEAQMTRVATDSELPWDVPVSEQPAHSLQGAW